MQPSRWVLAGLMVVAACGGGDDADERSATSSPTTTSTTTTTTTTTTTVETTTTTTTSPETSAPTTTTTAPTTTTTSAPPTTATTAPPTTAPDRPGERQPLRRGDRGPAVEDVQRRLAELHYWVGPFDGVYGTLTEQAVYAFQKVNGLGIDGIVGPDVRAALDDPAPPSPRSASGLVWEVDKARQVLMVVRDGEAVWIWNTSTGTEEPYTYQGRQLLADTPPGHHSISWQVDGWRDGALGRMWRPKYFHPDGIAIHGYESVPPRPASHGCVRVTIAAMDHIWTEGLAPVGTGVRVYGRIPR